MKNIHVLSTEKSSRLWLSTRKDNYLIFDKFPKGGVEYVEPKHIYITSDEEITGFENDVWVYNNGRVWFWQNTMALRSNNKPKKIILTTDQDLIKDGVQEIDDEFLEWFVENPNCEEVEVVDDIYFDDVEWISCYKIIIPKKEQKQHLIDMMKADEEIGLYEELKQETVKEAAEKFYPPKTTDLICSPKLVRDSFIAGAKWQKEQNVK